MSITAPPTNVVCSAPSALPVGVNSGEPIPELGNVHYLNWASYQFAETADHFYVDYTGKLKITFTGRFDEVENGLWSLVNGTSYSHYFRLAIMDDGNGNGVTKLETAGYTPGNGSIIVTDGLVHTIVVELDVDVFSIFVDGVLDYTTTHQDPSQLNQVYRVSIGKRKRHDNDSGSSRFTGVCTFFGIEDDNGPRVEVGDIQFTDNTGIYQQDALSAPIENPTEDFAPEVHGYSTVWSDVVIEDDAITLTNTQNNSGIVYVSTPWRDVPVALQAMESEVYGEMNIVVPYLASGANDLHGFTSDSTGRIGFRIAGSTAGLSVRFDILKFCEFYGVKLFNTIPENDFVEYERINATTLQAVNDPTNQLIWAAGA